VSGNPLEQVCLFVASHMVPSSTDVTCV